MEKLDTKLREAISSLLAAKTQAEREEVLQQYPELILPQTLEIVVVIQDFAEIAKDDFPAMLKKGREFLESKSKG